MFLFGRDKPNALVSKLAYFNSSEAYSILIMSIIYNDLVVGPKNLVQTRKQEQFKIKIIRKI